MKKFGRIILRVVLGLVLIAMAYLIIAPTGRYLLRAGYEEGKILWNRRPITAIVANPNTPPDVRAKLTVVLDARAFARDSIHLAAKQSFTTYSQLAHDTLVLVLSGAYRDRLEPVTWWFPIVGRVPYKGYFDFGAARQAEQALNARGFDAYLRPSPAFSTLGFFNDPLLSTTLGDDSLDLANTVIHELTHNTFYAAGQAVFNESFANFVGARGAAWFFRSRGDSLAARVTDARWDDDKRLALFWERTYHTIDSVYRAHPDSAAWRISAHDSAYTRARQYLIDSVGPQLRTIDPRYLERMRLDNAALLAQRIYLTDVDLFDRLYDLEHHDLRRTVTRVIELAKSRPADPFGALRAAVSGAGPAPADTTGGAGSAPKPPTQ